MPIPGTRIIKTTCHQCGKSALHVEQGDMLLHSGFCKYCNSHDVAIETVAHPRGFVGHLVGLLGKL